MQEGQGFVQEGNDVSKALCKKGTTSARVCARRERSKQGFVQEGNDVSKALCKKGTTLARPCARKERR